MTFVMLFLWKIQDAILKKGLPPPMRRVWQRAMFCLMKPDNRIEPRENHVLPLRLDGGVEGITQNVSASGIYFETDTKQAVGSEIDFTINFDTPGGPICLKCHGKIIRTEQRGKKTGAAVNILESKFAAGRDSSAMG